MLYAQVALEDQSVDFYCAQLSSPLEDAVVPYTGSYGQDGVLPDGGRENGWEDEQDLQVERAIAFVEKTSGASGRPAIIAGDWHSSVAAQGSDGGVLVATQSPEVLAALRSAFSAQEPPGYVEGCNYCPSPDNAYNGSIAPADYTHTFLEGFAPGSITDDEYWGTANGVVPVAGVPYEPPPDGGTGPVFEFYPRVVQVVRPPAP